MAILIKDMKMPSKCYNCNLCQIEKYGWGEYLYLCLAESESRDLRVVIDDPFSKPNWCPLVEVDDSRKEMSPC